MIKVNRTITIEDSELSFSFIRSSGPGGQNVNKVATAVQLRFNVNACATLSEPVKRRLLRVAGSRATRGGDIVITAQSFRTQERNRHDAIKRLVSLIEQASYQPPPRKKTKPSRAAKANRVKEKKQRGVIKKRRSKPGAED